MVYESSRPAAADENDLSATRRLILEKLGTTPVSVDELIEQCQTPAQIVMTILLELELAGRLRRNAGNRVYLKEVLAEEVG